MLDKKALREIKDAYGKVHDANSEMHNVWIEHLLFTWEWWMAVVITIAPWVIWYFLRKKDSTDRLMYAGLFIISIASWLDFLGVVYGLWIYHVDVYYSIPPHIMWDFSVIPVTVMLILQYKPHIHPFKKALFFATGSAFIGETFFHYIGVYEPIKWKYIYSFPIYIVLYLIAHYLANRNGFRELQTK